MRSSTSQEKKGERRAHPLLPFDPLVAQLAAFRSSTSSSLLVHPVTFCSTSGSQSCPASRRVKLNRTLGPLHRLSPPSLPFLLPRCPFHSWAPRPPLASHLDSGLPSPPDRAEKGDPPLLRPGHSRNDVRLLLPRLPSALCPASPRGDYSRRIRRSQNLIHQLGKLPSASLVFVVK